MRYRIKRELLVRTIFAYGLGVFVLGGPLKIAAIFLLVTVWLGSAQPFSISKSQLLSASPYLLLFILGSVNFFATDHALAGPAIKELTLYVLYALMMVVISSIKIDDRLCWGLIIVVALYGLLQMQAPSLLGFLEIDNQARTSRAFETLTGGSIGAFTLLACYARLREDRFRFDLALVTGLTLLLFAQRSALLAFLLVEVLAFLLTQRQRDKIGALIFLSFLAFNFALLQQGFLEAFRAEFLAIGGLDFRAESSGRYLFWQELSVFYSSFDLLSLLFGAGAKASMAYLDQVFGPFQPHNEFIKIIVEYGLVGTFLFSTLILLIMRKRGLSLVVLAVVFTFDNGLLYAGMMGLLLLRGADFVDRNGLNKPGNPPALPG